MLVGLDGKEVAINPVMVVLSEVEMKGVCAYYDEFKYVMEFLDQKKIDTELFISDIISLFDIEEKGFRRLLSSHDWIKILVRP